MILGGVVAVAAWGSFLAGGAYAPQPRLAKVALAITFLAGLSALSFTGKVLVGAFQGVTDYMYWLDRKDACSSSITTTAGLRALPTSKGRSQKSSRETGWTSTHSKNSGVRRP